MKFITILPALQLAATASTALADEGLSDFGRVLRHEAPVQRLREPASKASKFVFVEGEYESAAEIVAEVATNVATKTGKRGDLPFRGSKAFKVLRTHESVPQEALSYGFAALPNDFTASKSSKAALTTQEAISYDFTALSSKAAKIQDAFSYTYNNKATDYLSYDFGDSEVDSKSTDMSYSTTDSFDFGDEERPIAVPTSRPTAAWVRETDDTLDDDTQDSKTEEEQQIQVDDGFQPDEIAVEHDSGFGLLVFEYLNQCSSANIDTSSCLSSAMIYYLTSVDMMEDGTQSRRFLQALNEDKCMPPEVDHDFLQFIVNNSNAQCEGVGLGVSDEVRDATLNGFLTMFESPSCWAQLCDESSSPSDLFFRLLFEDVAKCAGVDTTVIHPCILNSIFDTIFSTDNEDIGQLRRALEDMSSCDQPNSAEIDLFVSMVLKEADATCDANTGDFGMAFDALTKIFGASTCWGGAEDCSEGSDLANDSYAYDDDFQLTITMDGTVCEFGGSAEGLATRTIDLSYYYLIETKSNSDENITASIQALERSLIRLVCGMERRRSLEHDDAYDDAFVYPIVLAVDSNPLDTVSSEYGCDVKSSDAQSCSVISGTASLIVPDTQDLTLDAQLELEAYTDVLPDIFANLYFDDPNIVSVEYVGQDASSLLPVQNVNAAMNDNQSNSQGSDAFTSIAIGLGGLLVAIGVVTVGLNKVKKNTEDPIHPDEKPLDDDSEGLQTSDLTYTNSLESDSSSIASYLPDQCAIVKDKITKHFILAEEEEASWRRLGITPSIRTSTSLEEVYEEDSCIDDSCVEEQSI